MHVSRLVLNMRNSQARRDAAAPYELHRTLITRGFGQAVEGKGRVLFRIEPERESYGHGGPVVLVQSSGVAPVWSELQSGYCLRIDGPRVFEPKIANGQLLAFRLLANPVARLRQRDESGNEIWTSSEKPHVRFRRRALLRPEEQQEWLDRQGMVHAADPDGLMIGGFRPRYVTMTPHTITHRRTGNISHLNKHSIPHVGVQFDGVLEVTDAAAFRNTLARGIGTAKAFGFGYLSVAPLR